MAGSYPYYKYEITQYLKNNFPTSATILDVGAGCGTYYNYLYDYFENIDAVEVFTPNIEIIDLSMINNENFKRKALLLNSI